MSRAVRDLDEIYGYIAHSLLEPAAALGTVDAIENAVRSVLQDGYRTTDIMAEGCKKVGCSQMGSLLKERIK